MNERTKYERKNWITTTTANVQMLFSFFGSINAVVNSNKNENGDQKKTETY